jgi:hypothetical protein
MSEGSLDLSQELCRHGNPFRRLSEAQICPECERYVKKQARAQRHPPTAPIPAPAKSPADELRELVSVMREMGVTKYERGDVRLELGAAPVESTPITDAQRHEMKRVAREQDEALLFASSEGFPIDEDEGASVQ